MNEFIRNENDPQTMPSLMASNVFGFKESSAYRKLRDYELDIPGVVFGAFAEYLTHLHEQEFMGSDHGKIQTAISSAHEMVEILASSSNPAIRALSRPPPSSHHG